MESLGRERVKGTWQQLGRIFASPPFRQVSVASLLFLLPLLVISRMLPPMDPLSWQRLNTWLLDKGVARIIARPMDRSTSMYAVSTGGELYWSGNEGQKWFHMSEGLARAPLEQGKAIDLAVDPQDAKIIHVVMASSFTFPQPMVYWTVDMGLSWQARSSLGRERVRAIAYGPTRDDLYVITNADLLKAMVQEGRSNDTEALQESFSQKQDNLYWVSIAPFQADTWVNCFLAHRLPEQVFPALIPIAGPSTTFEAHGQAEVLYIGTREKGLDIVVHTSQGTFRPSDTGQDAASLYVLGKATIHCLGIDPRDPQQIYAGTSKGLYASADGGRHWVARGKASLSVPVLAFLYDGQGHDTMYVGTLQEGVLYSQDRGQTWRPLGRGIQHAQVSSLALSQENGSRVLYAGTRSGLWQIALPD